MYRLVAVVVLCCLAVNDAAERKPPDQCTTRYYNASNAIAIGDSGSGRSDTVRFEYNTVIGGTRIRELVLTTVERASGERVPKCYYAWHPVPECYDPEHVWGVAASGCTVFVSGPHNGGACQFMYTLSRDRDTLEITRKVALGGYCEKHKEQYRLDGIIAGLPPGEYWIRMVLPKLGHSNLDRVVLDSASGCSARMRKKEE